MLSTLKYGKFLSACGAAVLLTLAGFSKTISQTAALACACEDKVYPLGYETLSDEQQGRFGRASVERLEGIRLAARCNAVKMHSAKTDILLEDANQIGIAAIDTHFAGQHDRARMLLGEAMQLIDHVKRAVKKSDNLDTEERAVSGLLLGGWPSRQSEDVITSVVHSIPTPKRC